METIYILVLQLIVGAVAVEFLPILIGGAILLIFTAVIGIIAETKNLLLWVIPILFFSRFYIVTTDLPYETKNNLIIQAKVYNGRGEIQKFNGKYLRERGYLILEKIPDGEYLLKGNIDEIIRKKGYFQYKFKIDTAVKKENGFFRKKLEKLIEKRILSFSSSEKNLYRAVVLGIREPIFPRIKNLFLKNGLIHILAISGLHIGIVILILKKIAKKLPLKKLWREIFILVGLTFYYLAVNLTPSVERAYIMGIVYILSEILYENNSLSKGLALSFIILLLINPVVYRDISFVLTYWAMLSICIWTKIHDMLITFMREKKLEKRNDKKRDKSKEWVVLKKIREYFLFSLYIQVSMAPIIFFIFGKFSLLTILRSIILTPIGILYIYGSFFLLILPIAPLVRFIYWLLIKGMEF